jgi:ornithine cyclodeaminase/alanine dehydrogenase-like protein (mu-crystallin family)
MQILSVEARNFHPETMSCNSKPVLTLTSAEVKQLLPMLECIELMADSLAAFSRGEVHQPLRTVVRAAGAPGILVLMPAYRQSDFSGYGLKAVSVFPENPRQGKDAHQGSVMLFDANTGELSAMMGASTVTALRTAAVSAVATRLLARSDAVELTIIGAGVQARAHLLALSYVRSFRRVRVVSRDPVHARQLVSEMQPQFPFVIEPVSFIEAALQGTDVIATVTNSIEPVLKYDWIEPGTHINAIGTHSQQAREIDSDTMAAASIFVDSRESALNEAGDYCLAALEGRIGPQAIRAEIGELLAGVKPGRTSSNEITLFKSLGLAIEDVACAEYLFTKALEKNVGTWVEF